MLNTKQRGFSLVELSIVTAFAIMLVSAGLWWKSQESRNRLLEAVGEQMTVVSNAVGSYSTVNYAQLKTASPVINGFANPMAPTIPELKNAGFLGVENSDTPAIGDGYTIQLRKVPSSCIPPDCDVAYMVYLNSPIFKPGTLSADVPAASLVASKAVNGGVSSYDSPSTISGPGGQWSEPNPFNVAGIVAIKGGYGAAGFDQFYRRDGSLPLTAALNGGGQDANDLRDINASGKVSSKDLDTSGTATLGGTVNLGRNSSDVVKLNSVAAEGAVCSARSMAYASDGSTYLVCYNGRWKSIAPKPTPGSLCGNYFSGSRHSANSYPCNGVSVASSCPAGYARRLIMESDDVFLYSCVALP